MPITARLSRRFYDKFGDDIVNELVEWLNQVDLAFRSDLHQANENNFQRMEAKLEQRLADMSARLAAIEPADRRIERRQLRPCRVEQPSCPGIA